jgi:hypothetical protein
MGAIEVLDLVASTRASGWKVNVSRGERDGRFADIRCNAMSIGGDDHSGRLK